MKVTFLGTGTSTGVPVLACRCAVCSSTDSRDKRLRPSVLLQWEGASVLIDTATDLRQQGLRVGLTRVDAVLFTHAHVDHILGLDELRQFNWRQGGPVPVYGSRDTLQALRRTFWYVFEDIEAGGGRPQVTPVSVDGPFSLLGKDVVPVPLFHGSLPILGFRIGPFAYLTDASKIPEGSHALLRGVDTLVLNALRPRPHPTHFSLSEAVEEASRIGARRTWLTHVCHEMPHAAVSQSLPDGVDLAWDGLIIEVDGPPRSPLPT
jgi:phosphoribosyl 1,2-cyclic phosphate phosphodiesterase